MWGELTDSETPFTDFRVEDDEGIPRAVFNRLAPEQGALLSYFLYPNKEYVGMLYLDLLKVSEGDISDMSYEDDVFKTTFSPDGVLVEANEVVGQTGEHVSVRLSLSEAKFLLLKWCFECMRWDALRWSAMSDETGSGSKFERIVD
jgi:hypothetical protein